MAHFLMLLIAMFGVACIFIVAGGYDNADDYDDED